MSNVITKDYTDYFKGRDWVHMLGFYAQDWRKFMTDHNRVFGSGPFFYTTNTFSRLLFHGDEVDCTGLEFHAAYGAWGSHTIEVVEPVPFSVPTMFSEIDSEGNYGLTCISSLKIWKKRRTHASSSRFRLSRWDTPTMAIEKGRKRLARTSKRRKRTPVRHPSWCAICARNLASPCN